MLAPYLPKVLHHKDTIGMFTKLRTYPNTLLLKKGPAAPVKIHETENIIKKYLTTCH